MRALVVYYSLAGTTRAVAQALAMEFGADSEEIRCGRYRMSLLSFFKAGYDSWKGRLPPIDPPSRDPSHYDLVVIGGPVWASHAATPVRTYLRDHASRFQRVAFFVTMGGTGSEPSLREMEQITGRAPMATLAVRAAEVKKESFGPAVASFAARLRAEEAARA